MRKPSNSGERTSMRLRLTFVLSCVLVLFGKAAYSADVVITVEPQIDVTADSPPIVVWIAGLESQEESNGDYSISQKGTNFTPKFLVVPAGAIVRMPNDDDVAHNVFSFSTPKQFNLGIYPKGTSKSVTFDTPGLIQIYCSIHQHMSASILVVPSDRFAIVNAEGTARIEDVPAGEYTLTVWDHEQGERDVPITVAEAAEVDIALEPVQPTTEATDDGKLP